MSLNDSKIRNLKSSAKPFKISDCHGLYLLVNPGGSRLWYLKYRINGKESRLGLGTYPDVSLADARQQSDGIRKLLAHNINPAQQRSAERATALPEETFKSVALSWHKSNRTWSECKHTRFSSTHFLRFPDFQPSAGILPASGCSGIHGDVHCCIHSASDPLFPVLHSVF